MPIPKDRRTDYDRARTLDAHGVTPSDVEAVRTAQQNKCPLCESRLSRFTLDFHPRTAALRGLLCRRCSTMLTMSQQDPQTHRNAARYLDGLNTINVPDTTDDFTL